MTCDLNKSALYAIKTHNMLQGVQTVIVACSGGADSMALLCYLYSNKHKFNINVRVAHVNHNLRAKQSKNDELFVKNYCKHNNIPIDIANVYFETEPGENECRIIRYEFFYELLKKYDNCKVATAHTQNDNAETLLLHIARGSGLQGLCGIAPVRDNIIRPLIYTTRKQAEEYLAENNLEYVTDESNFTLKYARNKVRINIMPTLKDINSQILESLQRLQQTAEITNNYMCLQAKELLSKAQKENSAKEKGYDSLVLAGSHEAVLKTALHMLISPYADATQKRIELAYKAILTGSGSVQLNKNTYLTAAQHFVRIEKNNEYTPKNEIDFCNEDEIEITIERLLKEKSIKTKHGFVVTAEVVKYEKTVNFEKMQKKDLKNVADYGKIQVNAVLRTKIAGDMFVKPFSNMKKPLKKVYSEEKLSANMREANPVLAGENEIVWAAGFGFAHNYLPQSTTKECLILKVINPSQKQ